MSGESAFHTMSECDSQMEVDANQLSMYTDIHTETSSSKPGYEGSIVPIIQQEVVIGDDSNMTDPSGGIMAQSFLQELQEVSQEVNQEELLQEEEVIELQLDPEDSQSSFETCSLGSQKVYTQLEPAEPWDTMAMLTDKHQQENSSDSGIQSASYLSDLDNSDAMETTSKKSFDRLSNEDDDDNDGGDLLSWTAKHPDNWTSTEVLDWIYHLAELPNSNIDTSQLRGEAFVNVDGPTLCRWSKADFIKADVRHGVAIYENFKALCGITGDLIPPEDITDSTGYNHPSCVNPLIDDIENGTSPIRSELDPYLPNVGNTHPSLVPSTARTERIVKIDGLQYTIDLKDVFDDITPITSTTSTMSHSHITSLISQSGFHSNMNHCSGGLVKQMAQTPLTANQIRHNLMTTCALQQQQQLKQGTSPIPTTTVSETVQVPVKRGRGRPRKNPRAVDLEDGSDGEYTPSTKKQHTPRPAGESGQRGGPRGKRPHSNRMLHLWEFIRDLLLDQKFNPHLIRWENRREGVFRVIKSKEVARMWGTKKQNPEMTYEKFSRSMRFCRTAGYFGEVPKDGKYPKKLCFAFGGRAHGWQPNSIVTKCYT